MPMAGLMKSETQKSEDSQTVRKSGVEKPPDDTPREQCNKVQQRNSNTRNRRRRPGMYPYGTLWPTIDPWFKKDSKNQNQKRFSVVLSTNTILYPTLPYLFAWCPTTAVLFYNNSTSPLALPPHQATCFAFGGISLNGDQPPGNQARFWRLTAEECCSHRTHSETLTVISENWNSAWT